jgi:hypothetical protein
MKCYNRQYHTLNTTIFHTSFLSIMVADFGLGLYSPPKEFELKSKSNFEKLNQQIQTKNSINKEQTCVNSHSWYSCLLVLIFFFFF